ncbi:MAG: TorD/DmsD family molecular chaperone [Planctomycetota bacterium]|jgi:TorA maturation chaperone TorD
MADVARWRERAYRLLSELFAYPSAAAVEAIPGEARDLLARDAEVAGLAYGPVLRFLRGLANLNIADVPELQQTFLSMFGTGATPEPIPLAETAFLDPEAMVSGWVIGSLESAYGTAGVSSAGAGGGESPDHIAVELEFVSILCEGEADAWAASDSTGASRALKRQVRFLEKHPSNWLPVLAREVRNRHNGLYALAAEAAHATVAHDIDFLITLRSELREPEGPEATGGIQNDDDSAEFT